MKYINKKYITLDKFIDKALYKKNSGFYMNKNPIGKNGDFITSPNISILFSEMIAIWIISFWESLKYPKKINLIEMGGGNGEMTFQLLETFNNFPMFRDSCKTYIFEKSPFLKELQRVQEEQVVEEETGPLEGIEDYSGLNYIICVANKIKSSVEPWNTIQKTNIHQEKFI